MDDERIRIMAERSSRKETPESRVAREQLQELAEQCSDLSAQNCLRVKVGVAESMGRHDHLIIANDCARNRQSAQHSPVAVATAAIVVAERLEFLDILSPNSNAFDAHLDAQLEGIVDYSDLPSKVASQILLIDEMPTRLSEMGPALRQGIHVEGVRTLLQGGSCSPLASGGL